MTQASTPPDDSLRRAEELNKAAKLQEDLLELEEIGKLYESARHQEDLQLQELGGKLPQLGRSHLAMIEELMEALQVKDMVEFLKVAVADPKDFGHEITVKEIMHYLTDGLWPETGTSPSTM